MFQIKVVEKIKTRILCSVTFFLKSCRLWDNVEKYGGARVAANDSMAACCRISKATLTQAHSCSRAPTHKHTHKYVILTAFPRLQWLRERTFELLSTCIAFVVCIIGKGAMCWSAVNKYYFMFVIPSLKSAESLHCFSLSSNSSNLSWSGIFSLFSSSK